MSLMKIISDCVMCNRKIIIYGNLYIIIHISTVKVLCDIIILHFVTNIHSWKSFLTALCVAKKLLSMASYTLFYISPLWSTPDIVILHLFTNILHHVQLFTNTELFCHWQHQRFSQTTSRTNNDQNIIFTTTLGFHCYHMCSVWNNWWQISLGCLRAVGGKPVFIPAQPGRK